mmetsp:Transcript_15503/g.24058  ORF Transcript_15503/g.24058 Transcript_15503/m.24058 type:complete len:91 (+) Transcript_15503:119-391(+)
MTLNSQQKRNYLYNANSLSHSLTLSLTLHDTFIFFISSTSSSSTPPLPSINTAVTTSTAKLKSNKKCPPIPAKNTSQKNGSQTITVKTIN